MSVQAQDYAAAVELGGSQAPVLIAAIVLAVIMAVGAVVFAVFFRKQSAEDKQQVANERTRGGGAAAARGGTDRMRARGGAARRRAAAVAAREEPAQSSAAAVYGDTDPDFMDADSEEEEDAADNRRGENRRDRIRRERQEAREAEQAAREARAKKKGDYEERRAQRDREREEREAQKELERKQAEEERQRQEDEEAAKWMGMISVENTGSEQVEREEEAGGMLGQFISYIQERKMVPLEDIANEFKLRTTDVLNRIQGLEAMGRLTGIMDERGKFIYIEPEEMQKVADFIKKKGRVSIAELAAKSSNFIDLEAKAAHVVTSVPMVDFDSLLAQPEPQAAAA